MRLTLITVAILVVIAGVLTVTSIYSSSRIYGEAVNIDTENATNSASANDTNLEGATATEGISMDEASAQFQWLSIALMIVVLIVGGLAAWFVLGAALRPIGHLTDQVEQITAHELDARIVEFQAGDELNRLADSFNHMLERLEHAFLAQKQFSSAAAHELKTPLTSIKTNIEVLYVGDMSSKEEYRMVFEAVQRQTNRMIHLVDDLFLVSSSDSYLLDERIELVEMLENIIQEQSKENIIPSLQFESNMEILGNIAMLHRALSNLVENAIKYNRPEGHVNIFVTKENPWAVITIEDTGIGIAPEHLPHIFQPFYRADASRSRKIGGSGLGLAIAKDTVQRHGGTVSASSTIGEGSTFIVRIPIL
ncbi:MAG: sensor histidine kinase [Lachnospiraceae bacterium]